MQTKMAVNTGHLERKGNRIRGPTIIAMRAESERPLWSVVTMITRAIVPRVARARKRSTGRQDMAIVEKV